MTETVARKLKGPQLTDRDALVLAWLGDQYGARVDVLKVLLARFGGGEAPLSSSGVRQQVDRWQRAGWVTAAAALGWTWVTPTARGFAEVGLGYPTWKMPATKLAHTQAVNVVRLWYESSPVRVAEHGPWVSERRLFAQRGQDSWHVPDGQTAGWAFEVELTPKYRPRYGEEVFCRLAPGVVGVVYLCPAHLVERVRRATAEGASKAGNGRGPVRLSVRVLPSVVGVGYAHEQSR